MRSAAVRLDLVERDDFAADAGVVAVACSPGGPTALANARGCVRSRGTQERSGDRTSAFCRSLELVRDLSCGEGTTPWPLITEAKVIAMRRTMERRDLPWMRARLEELDTLETAAHGRRAAGRDHRDAAAVLQAERDLAAVLEEVVAIKDVMRRRERGGRK